MPNRAVVESPTPPADTSVLWLSTSHRDLRISQAPADHRVALGPTLTGEVTTLQEPSVWWYGGQYHMIYSAGGSGSTYLWYAYAPSLKGPWTKVGQILGHGVGNGPLAGDAFHANVYVEGTTGYLYVPDTDTTGRWKLWTFALTDPTTLTAAGAIFSPPTGFSGVQGNTHVLKALDGTYVMAYETNYNNYQMGIATASSPTGPWTNLTLPVPTLRPNYQGNGVVLAIQNGGPCMFQETDGTFVMYYHAGPNGRPTDGYRATSTDLITWTIDNDGQPFIRRTSTWEFDQVADLFVVQAQVPVPGSPGTYTGGPWYAFWSGMQNIPSLRGRIMSAPMQPTLKEFDGYQWVPILGIADNTPPKNDFLSSLVATSNFTTTTVGSDVAVTGLLLSYTPTFNARAQIRMRMKVSSSATGSVVAKVAVTPTTPVSAAPAITYPTVSSQRDDMPGDSTKFHTLTVFATVDLLAGTSYTITGTVNNAAVGATTTVAFGGQYSEIELMAFPY